MERNIHRCKLSGRQTGGAQVVAYGVQSLRRDATKYRDTRKRRMERRQPDVHSNELLEKKKKKVEQFQDRDGRIYVF